MPMKLTDLALLSLQTAFMQKDLTTQGFCAGLQSELRDAAVNAYRLLMYSNIDNLKDDDFGHSLADELAWQFHVDYYDQTADIETKKKLVKQSIKIHRKKGTPQAVIDLLQTAFPTEAVLLEWFEYGGEPYHFRIIASEFDDVDVSEFLKALDSVKNARSYLDELRLFKVVFGYARNNIKAATVYTYEPKAIIGLAEPIMLAVGQPYNYRLLAAGDGTRMAVAGRSTVLGTATVSFDLVNFANDIKTVMTTSDTSYTVQLVPIDGYSCPYGVSVSMGGVDLAEGADYDYDPTTGIIKVYSVSGDIVITAEAIEGEITQLATPVISLDGNILTIGEVDNAEEYAIYHNGVHILTVKPDGTVTPV